MNQDAIGMFGSFRPAWQSFGVYFFGVLVLGVGPIINPDTHISPALGQLLASLFLAFILIKRQTSLYELTPSELRASSSFPKYKTTSVKVADITRVDLRRGLAQRALGVAHVHVYVHGQDTPTIKLFGVAQPVNFKQLLMSLGAGDTPRHGAFRR